MRRSAFLLLGAAFCFIAGCQRASDPGPQLPSDTAHSTEAPREPPAPTSIDRDLAAFFPAADSLREAVPAIGTGNLEVLTADLVRNVNVYARSLADEVVIVAVNRSGEAHSLRVEIPQRLRHAYEVIHATEPGGYRVQQDATALLLELPGRFGLVLTNRPAE